MPNTHHNSREFVFFPLNAGDDGECHIRGPAGAVITTENNAKFRKDVAFTQGTTIDFANATVMNVPAALQGSGGGSGDVYSTQPNVFLREQTVVDQSPNPTQETVVDHGVVTLKAPAPKVMLTDMAGSRTGKLNYLPSTGEIQLEDHGHVLLKATASDGVVVGRTGTTGAYADGDLKRMMADGSTSTTGIFADVASLAGSASSTATQLTALDAVVQGSAATSHANRLTFVELLANANQTAVQTNNSSIAALQTSKANATDLASLQTTVNGKVTNDAAYTSLVSTANGALQSVPTAGTVQVLGTPSSGSTLQVASASTVDVNGTLDCSGATVNFSGANITGVPASSSLGGGGGGSGVQASSTNVFTANQQFGNASNPVTVLVDTNSTLDVDGTLDLGGATVTGAATYTGTHDFSGATVQGISSGSGAQTGSSNTFTAQQVIAMGASSSSALKVSNDTDARIEFEVPDGSGGTRTTQMNMDRTNSALQMVAPNDYTWSFSAQGVNVQAGDGLLLETDKGQLVVDASDNVEMRVKEDHKFEVVENLTGGGTKTLFDVHDSALGGRARVRDSSAQMQNLATENSVVRLTPGAGASQTVINGTTIIGSGATLDVQGSVDFSSATQITGLQAGNITNAVSLNTANSFTQAQNFPSGVFTESVGLISSAGGTSSATQLRRQAATVGTAETVQVTVSDAAGVFEVTTGASTGAPQAQLVVQPQASQPSLRFYDNSASTVGLQNAASQQWVTDQLGSGNTATAIHDVIESGSGAATTGADAFKLTLASHHPSGQPMLFECARESTFSAQVTLDNAVGLARGSVADYLAKIDLLYTAYRRTIPNSVLNAGVDTAHEVVLFTTGVTQNASDWTKYVHGGQVTTFSAAQMFAQNTSGRLEGTFVLEIGLMGETWDGGAIDSGNAQASYYNHRGSTIIALDNSMYKHGYDTTANNKSYLPIGWHLNNTLDSASSTDNTDRGNPNLYWRSVGSGANTQSELVLEFPDMDNRTNTTSSEVRMVLKPLTDAFLF